MAVVIQARVSIWSCSERFKMQKIKSVCHSLFEINQHFKFQFDQDRDLRENQLRLMSSLNIVNCHFEFFVNFKTTWAFVGGAVASWLVRSTPERAVWVRALAGDIVSCSWARHFTLTVPLSTQGYKWVPANLMLGGNPAMD